MRSKPILFAAFLLTIMAAGIVLGQSGSYQSPATGSTYTGTSPIVVTGTAISCPTCGTGTGNVTATTLTNNVLTKGNGTTGISSSSVTDNGTTVATTEPFSSTGEIDSGANGGSAGVIGLNGSSSGKATFTANSTAGVITLNGQLTDTTTNASSTYQLNGKTFAAVTAPTISSGFGTSPSIVSSNGTTSFRVNVGTGGAASSGVIGLATASTNWNCQAYNLTAHAGNRVDDTVVTTASATNSITVQNQTKSTGAALAWTASDVLVLNCSAE